ncbi:MAG: helix-turn-helix transcriptional regulator [Oscillospiraceae bacterium]|nr:helix-turn-helix transcriptional regulator [Oscillospiraceae bacterium]
MTTGEKIRSARKKLGLTQKELGERIGLPYQRIGQYETGVRTPRGDMLQKIASALNAEPIAFLDDKYLGDKGTTIVEAALSNENLKDAIQKRDYKKALSIIEESSDYDMAIDYYSEHAPDRIAVLSDLKAVIQDMNEYIDLQDAIFKTFWDLTEEGQKKALVYIQDLAGNKKYQNNPDE